MARLSVEWDDAKNRANIAKHGLDFARASGVLKDVFAIERIDDRRNYGEERYVIIAMVKAGCSRSSTQCEAIAFA